MLRAAWIYPQESVAGAELDYINSVFGHNLAKLSLARAVGQAQISTAVIRTQTERQRR